VAQAVEQILGLAFSGKLGENRHLRSI